MLNNVCTMRILELSIVGSLKELNETIFARENIKSVYFDTEDERKFASESLEDMLDSQLEEHMILQNSILDEFNSRTNSLLDQLSDLNKGIVSEEFSGLSVFEVKNILNNELSHVKSHKDSVMENIIE